MIALGVGFGDPTPQEKEKNIVVYVVLGLRKQGQTDASGLQSRTFAIGSLPVVRSFPKEPSTVGYQNNNKKYLIKVLKINFDNISCRIRRSDTTRVIFTIVVLSK